MTKETTPEQRRGRAMQGSATPAEKAKETRQRHAEAQRARYEAQRNAIETARTALLRVMEREDATSAEILEAARLLVEIGK